MTGEKTLSRRQFLKVMAVGAAAAGMAWGARGWDFGSEMAETPGPIQETHLMMGTALTLTLAGDDPRRAKDAAEAALAEMRRLVGIFSRFDPASQLCQLNTLGRLRSPDPALVGVLRLAQSLHQASGGAFDVTVKPLLDLYRASPGQLPDPSEIRCALKLVDASQVDCDEGEIGFSKKGMGLILDGIAKGAVIDGGARVLREHGFTDVIVEAGGDLLASGSRPEGAPWKIGLRSPRTEASSSMPVLKVQDRAVATSGDYLQSFTPDHSAHHILDPRVGTSAGELASATVIAPTTVLADALATVMMVVGAQAGLELLQQFPGCEAYLVDKQLQAVPSPGLAAYLA